jgi:hypothetical protein
MWVRGPVDAASDSRLAAVVALPNPAVDFASDGSPTTATTTTSEPSLSSAPRPCQLLVPSSPSSSSFLARGSSSSCSSYCCCPCSGLLLLILWFPWRSWTTHPTTVTHFVADFLFPCFARF